ncbi:MAG: chemotaxis protein CheB [Polyangia bacterium]
MLHRLAREDCLVVAIGGSAGSIQVLMTVLSGLPSDFNGILLIAIHRPYGRKSLLADLLRRGTYLQVVEIVDSEELTSAVVYLSEPAQHLTLRKDGYRARLLPDPFRLRRNQSIDELFTSVAESAGPRAVGVLLSGMLDDGVEGLRAIKSAGGVTIVQDPEDARWPDMPLSALRSVDIDHVLAHRRIAPVLVELAQRLGGSAAPPSQPA